MAYGNGFEANPEGLVERGKRITSIYESYVAEKENVSKTSDRIASAWTGADSSGYVTQIHSYDADFKQLGEVLEKLGAIVHRHGVRLVDSRDSIKSAANRL